MEALELAPEHLQKALKLLRSSEETQLNLLLTVSGVDSKDSFDSVYHLWSYGTLNELVVKVRIPKVEVKEGQLPMVLSLSRFWKAANWHERETYDLVGIRYLGHPYPRRILNTWDWDGHPLRRDYLQPIDALNDKAPGSFR
ncbi:MAG: NADH-quinone oxidoreductase subunit C [Candidatus Obscuribacterales bacterium]|nr:NADH-quinone oxidoreductase subunit C [Candidatus Obscuribacterales bacterium]